MNCLNYDQKSTSQVLTQVVDKWYAFKLILQMTILLWSQREPKRTDLVFAIS